MFLTNSPTLKSAVSLFSLLNFVGNSFTVNGFGIVRRLTISSSHLLHHMSKENMNHMESGNDNVNRKRARSHSQSTNRMELISKFSNGYNYVVCPRCKGEGQIISKKRRTKKIKDGI